MKLSREYVFAIAVLVIILCVLGAVYQFYYKGRLEEYQKNMTRLESLDKTLKHLETTFSRTAPNLVVKAAVDDIQPLNEELARRAAFFTIGDILQVDEIPVGKMIRFFYEEQFNKLFNELRQQVANHVPPCYYNVDSTTFGAARPDEMATQNPNNFLVVYNLRRIKLGAWAIKTLMDAKASYIMEVAVWEPRQQYDGLLRMRSVGLHFGMAAADLVNFIDNLRLKEQYFNINNLRIQNRYLRWQPEPPLEVEMVLTLAEFMPPAAPATPGVGAAPGGSNVPANMLAREGFNNANRRPAQPEMTKWQLWKRWLRQYFWPF